MPTELHGNDNVVRASGTPTSFRRAIAFAVAPVGAIFTVFGYVWVVRGPSSSSSFSSLCAWVCLFAYPSELTIALPGHIYLEGRGRRGLLTYVLLGAITGGLPFSILAAVGLSYFAGWIWVGAVAGVMSAVLFWLLALAPFTGPSWSSKVDAESRHQPESRQ